MGQARDLDVAYVSVPELSVRKVGQRYTLLTRDGAEAPAEPPPGARHSIAVFRYESGDFRADLPVDDNELVLGYPGIWQRVAARPADALRRRAAIRNRSSRFDAAAGAANSARSSGGRW